MFKIFLLALTLLLFVACSKPQPPSPSEKVFEGEDLLIVYALRTEEVGRFDIAAELFEKLYKKSGKKEYLHRELHDMLAARKFDEVVKKVDELLSDADVVDPDLLRFKVLALTYMKRFREAKSAALQLVGITKKSEDYLLLADIYVQLKKYDMAVKYLEGAYSKNYDEKILDRISIILFMNLQRQKDAIAQLETHSRMFGCSERICNRLLSFYSKLGDVNGMLSVYRRYYKINPNEEILKKIVQLYVYKKDYIGLRLFLEEHEVEDDVLLQLYVSTKEYKKAYKLAYKLYKKTGNIDYLGQGAIYEYEAYEHPKRSRLKKIVKELEKVIAQKPSPLYLNYLGYLLIDHNIDVKKGMRYVKEALKEDPTSAYYLDSLAWGYYKLGKCRKAKRIFDRVRKLEGGDDQEVRKHYKKVLQCLNKRKNHSKKKKRSKKKKGAK